MSVSLSIYIHTHVCVCVYIYFWSKKQLCLSLLALEMFSLSGWLFPISSEIWTGVPAHHKKSSHDHIKHEWQGKVIACNTMLWWPVTELEAGRCEAGSDNYCKWSTQVEAQSCFACLLFQEACNEDFLFWKHIVKTSAAGFVANFLESNQNIS